MQKFDWKDLATKHPFILCLQNILISEKDLQIFLTFVGNVMCTTGIIHKIETSYFDGKYSFRSVTYPFPEFQDRGISRLSTW